MKLKPIVIALIIAASAAGLWLLSNQKPHAEESASEHQGPPPAAVTVEIVETRSVPVSYEYVGRIAGSREVEVRARVTGIIEKRLYEEGSRVKEGSVLFKIDPAMYQAQVDAAEAALAQAQAQLKQAEREYNRIKPLMEVDAVSRKELDDAQSTLDLAKAAVMSAEAGVSTARINLDYTDVKAPISGITGRALKVEGSLAEAVGDSLLTTMAQTDPVYVDFSIPETTYLRLQREVEEGRLRLTDQTFKTRLKSFDGSSKEYEGVLEFSDYKSDPATGAFAARATISNADGRLAPGQFARVSLEGAEYPDAVVIPQRAVLDGPAGKFVYVAGQSPQGTIAEVRPVEVGEWVRINDVAGWIILSGLQNGDQVIVDGVARIFFPGAPIVVTEPDSETSGSTSEHSGSAGQEKGY